MRTMRGVSMCLMLLPGTMVMADSALRLSAGCTEQTADHLLGLPAVTEIPLPNHLADKAELGKKLFFDKQFSADGSISCATCHSPERGFIDGLPRAQGIHGQLGTRNTPTLINAAYASTQFWHGRRESLEKQATDPRAGNIYVGPSVGVNLPGGSGRSWGAGWTGNACTPNSDELNNFLSEWSVNAGVVEGFTWSSPFSPGNERPDRLGMNIQTPGVSAGYNWNIGNIWKAK